jgi:inner membrane protein
MHPPSHFVLAWLVGHRLPERRDRLLVAWAGLAPDLDGLTLLAGEIAYGRWHHVLAHGLLAALLATAVVALLAQRRWITASLAFGAFHLHLICDLLGSGREWGIAYLWPLTAAEITFRHGWPLPSWQNVSITAAALGACLYTALRHGRTFAEALLPARADRAVVAALRQRFQRRRAASA